VNLEWSKVGFLLSGVKWEKGLSIGREWMWEEGLRIETEWVEFTDV